MKKVLAALALVLLLSVKVCAADNVVILLDTSGSMETRMRSVKVSRLKAAQDALETVAHQLPANTNVGLLTFNGWVYDLQPIDRDKLILSVHSTRSGGGTPLGQFMKTGADALLQAREKNRGVGVYRLLVVTDGEADSTSLMNKYATDIVSRGILLDTIGLDMKSDHTLKALSKKYMRADDPESLKNAVQTALAEVGKGGGDDGVGNFEMLNGLSSDGAKAIIAGLTEHQNHGIGEDPPVKVVDENGNVKYIPAAKKADGGMGAGWICLIILGVILGVGLVIILICAGSGRRY
jgi:uncharacterized protein YegL